MKLPALFLRTLPLCAVVALLACERVNPPAAPLGGAQPQTVLPDSHAWLHPVHDSLRQDTFMQSPHAGEFNVAEAMELVYGLYDRNMECSQWVCGPQEKTAFASKIGPDGKLYTRPAGTHCFEAHGQKHIFLVTETASRESDGWEDCHACAPIVGVVLFVEQNGAWQLEALKRDLGIYGAYGESPAAEVVDMGAGNHGLRFDLGYSNQGFTESTLLLVGLPSFHFAQMLEIPDAAYSNEGYYSEDFHPERLATYASELKFQPGADPAFYDLEVITSGARPRHPNEGTDVTPFRMVRTYRPAGDHYLMVDSTLEWMDVLVQ